MLEAKRGHLAVEKLVQQHVKGEIIRRKPAEIRERQVRYRLQMREQTQAGFEQDERAHQESLDASRYKTLS